MTTEIILEFGCNHQGSLELAKKMVDDAVLLGVDGVKLQKRDVELIPAWLKQQPRNPENSFGTTYYDHRKALELSEKDVAGLIEYSHSKQMAIGTTVFDLSSAERAAVMAFNFIKLPSQFYSNYELNRFIFSNKSDFMKTMVSTGMHTQDEIYEWQYFGKADVTFYCRSMYPFGKDQLCLSKLSELKEKIIAKKSKSVIGYSSHDLNGDGIKYAVLCGAKVIERHYTTDKTLKGSDHKTVSSDFQEMEKIIEDIKEVEKILGAIGDLDEDEKKVKAFYRGV